MPVSNRQTNHLPLFLDLKLSNSLPSTPVHSSRVSCFLEIQGTNQLQPVVMGNKVWEIIFLMETFPPAGEDAYPNSTTGQHDKHPLGQDSCKKVREDNWAVTKYMGVRLLLYHSATQKPSEKGENTFKGTLGILIL